VPHAAPPPDTAAHWLDPDERAAWLGLVRTLTTLPSALDAQLRRDSSLNFFEYLLLAMLSEQADATLRMSDLAALTDASLSRLSHAVTRLEHQGLLARHVDGADARCTNVTLTDAGLGAVESAAPGHVATVRRLVIDALTPAQLRQLRSVTDRILARVDPGDATTPMAERGRGTGRGGARSGGGPVRG
jgi:DNA-binding MarR family transcriptional regulator